MREVGVQSLAQGMVALAGLLIAHQSCDSLWRLYTAKARARAPVESVCAAPVAIETRFGLQLSCADAPSLPPYAPHAVDRGAVAYGRGTTGWAKMPCAWSTTLGFRLDLNRVQASDLQALRGIGAHTAEAIVAHRDKHGPYKSVADLKAVRGVGPARVAALRHLVTVGDGG